MYLYADHLKQDDQDEISNSYTYFVQTTNLPALLGLVTTYVPCNWSNGKASVGFAILFCRYNMKTKKIREGNALSKVTAGNYEQFALKNCWSKEQLLHICLHSWHLASLTANFRISCLRGRSKNGLLLFSAHRYTHSTNSLTHGISCWQ